MKFAIKKASISLIEDASLMEKAAVSYPVEFIFDETWDGLSKTALFKAGGKIVSVALTDDRCVIPSECLETAGIWLQVSVSGSGGSEPMSTDWCRGSFIMYRTAIDLGKGGGCCGGSGLPDDVYERIMAAIGDLNAAGFEGKTLAEVFREVMDSICGTATDEEVEDVLDGIFGQMSDLPEIPGGTESRDNTATDQEVDDMLNDIFGESRE